jgi:hypothetical protein
MSHAKYQRDRPGRTVYGDRREGALKIISDAGRFTPPAGQDGNHWIEHLRVADLSVGTYSVPRGGVDDQQPHTEDEI